MATSNKGPGSRTQSYTKRGLTRADIARLKKIRDKPSPKGTTMAKTDKFMERKAKIGGKAYKGQKILNELKAIGKKHGSKIGKAAGSAILGTLSTFGPGKKLGMAVKGVKLAGKGAKTAAAGYVKLKTKIAKLKKKEKLSQVLKRKNKLSGVYGGKAAVVGGAAAAVGSTSALLKLAELEQKKYIRDSKKNKRTPMEKARDRKPSGRLTSDDIKRFKNYDLGGATEAGGRFPGSSASPAIKAAYKLARARKAGGRLNADDIKNARQSLKKDNPAKELKANKEARAAGRRAMKKASPGGGRSRRS